MRASEFIGEATNPSAPPPKRGDAEFDKSMKYFIQVVQQSIRNYNDELKYLNKTNTTEYNKKTADEDELRKDLRNNVVDELMKKGGQYFVQTDKTELLTQFNLDRTNSPFDGTSIDINVSADPIGRLVLKATDNWYANRYTRFTNPKLWSRISGASVNTPIITVKVANLENTAAKELESILGVSTDNDDFWIKIKAGINNPRTLINLANALGKVYVAGKTISGTEPVKSIDQRAAMAFQNIFGKTKAVSTNEFWNEFTDALTNTTTLAFVKNLLAKYYP